MASRKSCATSVCGAVATLWLAGAPVAEARDGHAARAATAAPGGLRESDPSPAGAAAKTTAAPGGADGGAGGYGKVGDPYSQAGYGAGAFGDGRTSPK